MFQLEVRVTQEELQTHLEAAKRQGVSVSDHLRLALGMRSLGDPPMFSQSKPHGRLRLVHDRTRPVRR